MSSFSRSLRSISKHLEVDPAVARSEDLNRSDDLLGVLGVEADRPRVDAAEPLEQRGLALHHRHRRGGAEVAQPEHGRAVGDDRDGVALDRESARVVGIGGDGLADPRDPRGVGAGEVVAGPQRDLRLHLQLAAQMQQERPVRDLADLHPRQRVERLGDLAPVVLVQRVAADVDDERRGVRLHDVQRRHHTPDLPDRDGEVARCARRGGHLDAGGDGISGSGDGHGGNLPPPAGHERRARSGPFGGCGAARAGV
jgi:hypothetical protein